MKRISVLLLIVLTFASPALFAQGGGAGMSFLKIGVGGRSIGMGETGVTHADRGAAMYYNPALVAGQPRAAITFMHNEWVEDLTTDYLGVVIPFSGWSLGVNLGLTSVDNIEIRTQPGNPEGTFDSRNFAGGMTVGVPLFERFEAGVTVKYLFEKIYTDVAGGYAFDFGVHWKPVETGDFNSLRLGFAAANLGSMSELRSTATKLPSLLRYGASYDMAIDAIRGGLLVEAGGVSLLAESSTHVHAGLEFRYMDMLYLRTGYQTGYEVKGFSAGLGASFSTFRFDYAYTPFQSSFGVAHTVSLSTLL
jgi:hypothetical protein